MLTEPDFIEKKIVIVMPQRGDKISFKNDNIIITDIDGKIKFQLTCYKLFAVFTVTSYRRTGYPLNLIAVICCENMVKSDI